MPVGKDGANLLRDAAFIPSLNYCDRPSRRLFLRWAAAPFVVSSPLEADEVQAVEQGVELRMDVRFRDVVEVLSAERLLDERADVVLPHVAPREVVPMARDYGLRVRLGGGGELGGRVDRPLI